MMSFDTTLIRYTEVQSQQFFEQVAERARAVPGVKSVTLSTSVPMLNDSNGSRRSCRRDFSFRPGKTTPRFWRRAWTNTISTRWRSRILQGRNFRIDDSVDAPRVAIVNQQFAQHYWPARIRSASAFDSSTRTTRGSRSSGSAKRASTSSSPSHRRSRLPAVPAATAATDDHARAICRRSVDAGRTVARNRAPTRWQSTDLWRANDGSAVSDARGRRFQGADHGDRRHGTDGTRPRDRRPLRPGRVCGRPAYREIGIRMAVGADRAPWYEWCCDRASCSRWWDWALEWWRASARGNCSRRRSRAATIRPTSSRCSWSSRSCSR